LKNFPRHISTVLGIETSCDDTGAAVVTNSRTILGEALKSQTRMTVRFGGVLPTIASQLHAENIHHVVDAALHNSGLSWNNLSAVAVTVKPGMAFSLKVGVQFAKELTTTHGLPIIPIHHMEAHALTAMLTDEGGGHSLLALARGLEDFLLLGTSRDISPGECLDKVARRLRLSWLNNGQFAECAGGQAIEILARNCPEGIPGIQLPTPRSRDRDCDFSFSGIHVAADRLISQLEQSKGTDLSTPQKLDLTQLSAICASVQTAVTRHLCRRLQRAVEFCARERLLPVVSGGVGSNLFIRGALARIANHYGMRLVAPPPRLCTDNGVMIAWNGALLHDAGLRIINDSTHVDFSPTAVLGEDIRDLVRKANIKVKPLKLTSRAPP
uniref:N(6)-L-threonylcarbamoyladenine synthase n=1 Tax=Schistocephalus solidus TaxID=70667 RepID=A0A183SX19_SCHSO